MNIQCPAVRFFSEDELRTDSLPFLGLEAMKARFLLPHLCTEPLSQKEGASFLMFLDGSRYIKEAR